MKGSLIHINDARIAHMVDKYQNIVDSRVLDLPSLSLRCAFGMFLGLRYRNDG